MTRPRPDGQGNRSKKSPLIVDQWQPNGEGRAELRRALDLDRAMVIFDHLFRDIQTETGAALSLFGREIRLENLCQLRRENPIAGVLHPDVHVEVFPQAAHGDRPLLFRGSLHRIDDHILNRPHDLQGIAEEQTGILRNIGSEFDAVLRCN